MLSNDLKFLLSRAPSYLVFHVTNRCNLNCSHCFNYKIKEQDIDELSLEEINRISMNLGHIKYLTLAGGEPLMRADLNEIAGIFYQNNDLHILNIVTNGWFTDRIVACVKTLLANYPLLTINIGVSIDGSQTIHDELRNQPGSHKKALETIKSLRTVTSNRLSIMAVGTYNVRNRDVILPTATFFSKEIGVPYYLGLIRGEPRDPELKAPDIDHFRQVRHEIQKLTETALPGHYPFRSIRLAVDETVADIVYNSYKHDRCLVKCRAGTKGFVITAAGDIPLCEMLDVRLGNLRETDYDPLAILRSEYARQEIKKIVRQKCHCTWECFQVLNVVFSPRLYPGLVWKAIKKPFF